MAAVRLQIILVVRVKFVSAVGTSAALPAFGWTQHLSVLFHHPLTAQSLFRPSRALSAQQTAVGHRMSRARKAAGKILIMEEQS